MPSPNLASGLVVWIEGLPGSGKSTLSRELERELSRAGYSTEVLDGEELRRTISHDLGFSRKDRETHARRVSLEALTRARSGKIVLVAMVTPYETARQAARAAASGRFVEVWLDCPIDVCRRRNPHGLYSQAADGKIRHLTGVDDPFEVPLDPEIVVDTSRLAPVDSAHAVMGRLGELHRLDSVPRATAP